jgi:Fe2+ transport system protein FeoA
MVRCPHCGYEFVESGKITDMLKNWIRRGPRTSSTADGLQPLTAVLEGTSAPIASISASTARLNRLASFGLVPGTEVRVVARKPTVMLEFGATSLALDDEVARGIFVRVA